MRKGSWVLLVLALCGCRVQPSDSPEDRPVAKGCRKACERKVPDADPCVYFHELGIKLLKPEGFIVSEERAQLSHAGGQAMAALTPTPAPLAVLKVSYSAEKLAGQGGKVRATEETNDPDKRSWIVEYSEQGDGDDWIRWFMAVETPKGTRLLRARASTADPAVVEAMRQVVASVRALPAK
jgi:hypothetical protein